MSISSLQGFITMFSLPNFPFFPYFIDSSYMVSLFIKLYVQAVSDTVIIYQILPTQKRTKSPRNNLYNSKKGGREREKGRDIGRGTKNIQGC